VKFTAKSVVDKNLKIGYHVAKLEPKIEWFHFFPNTVYNEQIFTSKSERHHMYVKYNTIGDIHVGLLYSALS